MTAGRTAGPIHATKENPFLLQPDRESIRKMSNIRGVYWPSWVKLGINGSADAVRRNRQNPINEV
jgi:hypothetical protein